MEKIVTYEDLSSLQKKLFDLFIHSVINEEHCLEYELSRGVGHTTIIKTLGLHLQALGYRVGVWSAYNNIEYIAEAKIKSLQGMKDMVILIDHLPPRSVIEDLIEEATLYNITLVGFKERRVKGIHSRVDKK